MSDAEEAARLVARKGIAVGGTQGARVPENSRKAAHESIQAAMTSEPTIKIVPIEHTVSVFGGGAFCSACDWFYSPGCGNKAEEYTWRAAIEHEQSENKKRLIGSVGYGSALDLIAYRWATMDGKDWGQKDVREGYTAEASEIVDVLVSNPGALVELLEKAGIS